jgi:hypothetical protein
MNDRDPKTPKGEYNREIIERDNDRSKAKRMVTGRDFSNYNQGEWDDTKKRRNVMARAGYRHPKDAALAMIDVYYTVNEKTAKPESIAASAIYAASIIFNCKEKQSIIGNECGVTSSTIRMYYVDLLEYIEA